MRKVKDRSKRAETPHVSEEGTPFNSPCLCRFYLAGYAVSTMQAAPFLPCRLRRLSPVVSEKGFLFNEV